MSNDSVLFRSILAALSVSDGPAFQAVLGEFYTPPLVEDGSGIYGRSELPSDFLPRSWRIGSDLPTARETVFRPGMLEAYATPDQLSGKSPKGEDWRGEIRDTRRGINLKFLLWLQDNPEHLEGFDRSLWLFALDTIVLGPKGIRCVGYLIWGGDRWELHHHRLDSVFDARLRALVARE